MKRKVSKQFLSVLLAFVMIVGLIPASVLTVHAGHSCPECQEWIDGSPYCSECFACDECIEMCYQCGKCTGCTGSDICDGCTSEEGGNICIDCAAEKDSHCPGCGDCYFNEGLWCEECGLCVNCSEHDQECSAQFGAILCKECAAERGNHCPECEQCYFDVGSWCEECGKCEDCSPACLYCCEEEGTIICEECAIESGMHCTECYENDTFIPGHEYQICVFLKTDDGYTFYHTKDFTMLFTASVNRTAATGNTTTSWGLTEQTIRASFPCQGKEITTVMVNGLSTPKAGEKPDYTASVAYPEWYQLDPNYADTNGIVWYDSDDYQMEPTDTFVAGKKYKVEIKLISATLNGANTSQFTSPVSAYINGKQVVENGIWDAVYAGANTVYIYYTFPKGAEYTGVMVSGSVTSFNDANGDITLQLIPEGYSEAAYETVVRGNTVEYKFSHVAAGTYTLKVMKENHVTREYTVVVGNSSVIQDVKIHLKGDTNGDSKVNTSDVGKANSHAKGISTLSGSEFACADVNGDGKVNTSDVGKMNAHIKGSSKLW